MTRREGSDLTGGAVGGTEVTSGWAFGGIRDSADGGEWVGGIR